MSIAIPEPSPDDVSRGLTALEQHLADVASTGAKRTAAKHDGETRRVRQLRAEVAEAHLLARLQEDDTPLLVDSRRVRERRKAAQEAARLHALGQDPAMRAWQAARMRRLLVATALVALALALAWSTAGVQAFAADGAAPWSPAWLFAWLVEPFMSLALLVVVSARAYLGARGAPLSDRRLIRIEWLFLGLTLGMNAWPYLPGVAETFSLSRLVLHLLGPIVAVAVVIALPIILAAFAALDHAQTSTPHTWSSYRSNAVDRYPGGRGDGTDIESLTSRARRLIAAGELPPDPGADKIRRALRCGMDTARAVRDALARPTAG
ncbi:conjugal transfer protein TraI [Nonomuraea sp. SMC257]|uniref:Conjugal transfer protein TraI n=1 Tax=Nonomuraea montanisoli TaxID=2741721 RepID=A0A7Y6I8U0_9ACTN|nr:conjugal transfer protein TraI [Nonomuraea montanisoli]NUW33837.1 conjugal transfer protein TraI [Nonomuraea montanisoli]